MKKIISSYYSLVYSITILTIAFGCESCDPETPAPVIESLTPSKGISGDPVILKGNNFGTPTKIRFNLIDSHFFFGTNTEITTVVPPGADIGINSVSIITAGGQSNNAMFEVLEDLRPIDPLPPTLEKSFPSKNFISYPVLIYGDNLSSAEVTFNDIPAIIFTGNQKVVTTSVPDGVPTGTVKIKIKTSKGESNTIDFVVEGPPPPGIPIVNFSIVSVPPPGYVPTISNNWSCGLFSDNGDGTFVDLNTENSDGEFSTVGRYEYGFDNEKKYNFLNYVEITDSEEGVTYAGHFSSKWDNPCVLEMVLISSKTGELLVCTFNRKLDDEGLVCEE